MLGLCSNSLSGFTFNKNLCVKSLYCKIHSSPDNWPVGFTAATSATNGTSLSKAKCSITSAIRLPTMIRCSSTIDDDQYLELSSMPCNGLTSTGFSLSGWGMASVAWISLFAVISKWAVALLKSCKRQNAGKRKCLAVNSSNGGKPAPGGWSFGGKSFVVSDWMVISL